MKYCATDNAWWRRAPPGRTAVGGGSWSGRRRPGPPPPPSGARPRPRGRLRRRRDGGLAGSRWAERWRSRKACGTCVWRRRRRRASSRWRSRTERRCRGRSSRILQFTHKHVVSSASTSSVGQTFRSVCKGPRLHRAQPTLRYDTKCYFNARSKANMSQLNLPHGTDN